METWISVAISLLALSVSIVTAWLTFLKKGMLLMTQPTSNFLGPDKGYYYSHIDIMVEPDFNQVMELIANKKPADFLDVDA